MTLPYSTVLHIFTAERFILILFLVFHQIAPQVTLRYELRNGKSVDRKKSDVE
ncbi:hypothetical protein BYT27DRAFT_7201374 [Phlegmacium glaucopus]|nr:hypothetical protein BYT27DRAFT_7201374 [Phlegmacium glaucopus]